jgi:hypothetical protein
MRHVGDEIQWRTAGLLVVDASTNAVGNDDENGPHGISWFFAASPSLAPSS